jgi:hypothetical protein
LPCPEQDEHLRGKLITFFAFPHLFQLQPWLVPAPPLKKQLELSSPERTAAKSGTMQWSYEKKIKVS